MTRARRLVGDLAATLLAATLVALAAAYLGASGALVAGVWIATAGLVLAARRRFATNWRIGPVHEHQEAIWEDIHDRSRRDAFGGRKGDDVFGGRKGDR